ncbi:MAG: glutamate racemase [Clostridia bacterium]|nr:glutamate racemase [Clostridia bacterium]
MNNRPIGIFDSGLGGLTCIDPLVKALPNENILYFGDTARTPYGSKSPQTICEFSLQIAEFLVQNGAKMLVIACNTITSVALDALKQHYPQIPILGIIEPAAQNIAEICTQDNSIGIIGTKATIQSKAYEKAIEKHQSAFNLHPLACPAFVPLIEEGIVQNEIMDLTVHYYLDDFIRYHKIDTLVLGCTHYPLIQDNILRQFPPLHIINPSETIVAAIKSELEKKDLLATKAEGESTFYASDLSENFVNMISRIGLNKNFNIALRKF